MGKYSMYEPYGYEDNSNYISKKDQIERELQQNRINDCKEFASVEYDTTLKAFVFKNVKNQVRGYAYMADIIPSDLIADAYYNTESKNIVITFVNGKTVNIPLDDLIDVVEAGDGIKNVDGKFYINLAENCERFLTVDENGLKLSGVQDAIDAERDRAISAETKEYDRATKAEDSLASAIRQEATDRSNNDNLIRQTIGNDFTTNPTETVSYKFDELSEKVQKEIDDRGTAVSQEAQLRELGDGNLSSLISQEATIRTSEVTELRNNITSEKTRAEKKESELQQSIEGLESDKIDKSDVYTKSQTDSRDSVVLDDVLTRIWTNKIPNSGSTGYFKTVNNQSDGSYGQLWNEDSGGGAQYYNKTANIISFVGVNSDNADGICAQIYSKGKGNNVGSRLNVNPNGMFYTKGKSNSSFDENDEIVTKKELKELLSKITELESRLKSLI